MSGSPHLRPPEGRANTADILCIGQQRAMTTWLHQVLGAHPQTWEFPNFAPLTSTTKEAQYWTRNHHRGPDWYRVVMTPPEHRARKSMDMSPDYLPLTDSQIAECHALSPGARVICILRDPLARALSALRMHTMWDTSNAPPDEVTMALDASMMARIERARLWDHAAAAGHLRRWARAYGDILVLNMEDLVHDPVTGALTILDHAGLDADAMTPRQRAALESRARSRVWATPAYRATPDLVHFLHGATWAERQDINSEFGFKFSEFEAILQSASELSG
jgi:hypothetical protein